MDYFSSKRFLNNLPDWETGTPVMGPVENYLPRMRALLNRLDNPQKSFPTVIVGGTNGKGTVSSLLAALLQVTGRRVGLYISPHLHSLRERIQIDGLLAKDRWAEGVSHLQNRTTDFVTEGYGSFSKFEALTSLAAHFFAVERVDIGVFEVGLGGRYDATNAWDADLAVLTSIDVDHVAILGNDLLSIASEKFQIARSGCPLFTTAEQRPEVIDFLRSRCKAGGIDLYVAGQRGIQNPDAAVLLPYPAALEQDTEHASVYRENSYLATAVAKHLAGPDLQAALVTKILRGHHWPGRFETASQHPRVILDGAHNPAAANRLVRDLRAIAPLWTFVIGVNRGHDAGAILAALAPAASRFVLTESEHPKACPAAFLADCAPSGLRLELEPDCRRALKGVLSTGVDEYICVTGTLSLVARTREALQLPHERDGVTEDVVLESLECLERACCNLNLRLEVVSKDNTVRRLVHRGKPLYFWRNHHPFNDGVGTTLAEDKAYQYELFDSIGLPVPRTVEIFNPFADERFNRYKRHKSVDAIIAAAEADLDYPMVVKKYRSSMAMGVSLEANADDLAKRLHSLFENTSYFDNIVLLQEYLRGPEFRAVASGEELLLAYEKVSESSHPSPDLNPLHHNTGRAIQLTDPELLVALEHMVVRIAQVINLGFYAIDTIRDNRGFHILEINANPICFFYNRCNGRADFVRVYERLLDRFLV